MPSIKFSFSVLILLASAYAHALPSFGNGASTCASQGQWTRDALAQTDTIQSAIVNLRDDPNCKGIESILPNVQAAHAAFQQQSAAAAQASSGQSESIGSLNNKVQAVAQAATTMIATGTAPEAVAAYDTLGKLVLQNTTLLAKQGNYDSGLGYGVAFMDEAMKTLPSYQLCMNNHPNQALAIVGATVQMAAAMTSNGEGVTSRLGNSIANLVTFMRNSDYAKMMRGPNESRYWNSMSCLVETTSQAYCQANETYRMLDFQEKNRMNSSDKAMSGRKQNLLDGYYLLTRELPTATDWMQKVQIGVTPRLQADADNQSVTLNTQNNYMIAAKTLQGSYAEYLKVYDGLDPNDLDGRRAYASKAINNIFVTIASNGMPMGVVGSGKPGDQNFFTNNVPQNKLPYYLLGRNSIPQDVLDVQAKTNMTMQFGDWVTSSSGGANKTGYQPDFDDPDKLMHTVGDRLNQLIDSAGQKASAFYRQRMVVDPQNLVNESLTSNNLSVVESFRNMRNYLAGLQPRARADKEAGQKIASSIQDTIDRIDIVLKSYSNLQSRLDDVMKANSVADEASQCANADQRKELINNLQTILNRIAPGTAPITSDTIDESLKKKVSDLYSNVINTVYEQFNVQMQREGFLANRINTFVKYDYSNRIRNQEQMTDYQKQIFVVAGKNFLDSLQKANGLNPVSTEQDLNSAQVVNTKNLQSVEALLSTNFHDAIDSANRVTGGEVRGQSSLFSSATSPVRVSGTGDENGSFDQFRAKLCVQTLAFDNYKDYQPYCAGSVLKSRFKAEDPKNKNLVVNYDQLQKERASGKGPKSKYVCALRNYLQQNEAYWLLHADN